MNLSHQQLNSSSMSTYLQYQNFHETFYSTTLAKVGYFFILLMTHVIGPMLLAGIIIFEKKGGDSQKRNIINRLLSMALTNLIIYTTLVGGSKLCREMFGLISFDIMIWVEFFGYVARNNLILFLNEMMFIKYLNIIVWKRVKGLNDSFLECFLSLTTLAWSLCQFVLEHIQFEMNMYVFKISSESFPGSIETYR